MTLLLNQSAKKTVESIGKPPYELPHLSAFLNFESVAPFAAEQNVYLNCFQFGVIVYSETPELSFSFIPSAFVSDGMPLYAFESVHVRSRYGISCHISAALSGSSVAALERLHAAAVGNFQSFLAKEKTLMNNSYIIIAERDEYGTPHYCAGHGAVSSDILDAEIFPSKKAAEDYCYYSDGVLIDGNFIGADYYGSEFVRPEIILAPLRCRLAIFGFRVAGVLWSNRWKGMRR